MSIKEYKKAFSGIEPDQRTRDTLIAQILKEEGYRSGTGERAPSQGTWMKRAAVKGTPGKKNLRPGILAACIAAMVLCLSVTAAADFDLNDIFQGFFRRQAVSGEGEAAEAGKAQETVPLSSDDAFLASAGNAIYEETSGNGLKLTVRGTVSDGNALYAAVDVETEDGAAFSKEQEGVLKSYTFEEVWLQVEGGERQRCALTRIDDGSVQGKAVFLLAETCDTDLNGKQVSLSLSNLLMGTNEAVDLGMDRTLGELMTEFEPLEEGGIAETGSSVEADEDGNEVSHQSFIAARTDKRIRFSDTFPEAALSNLGIWTDASGTGSLLLNLELGGELTDSLLDQKPLMLVDARTGQELSGSSESTSIGEDYAQYLFPELDGQSDLSGAPGQETVTARRYCFNNIGENQLKNAVLALGGAGSQEELVSGIWELDFTVNYEETMKIWAFDETIQAGGLHVKKIGISPVSAMVEFDTLSDENPVPESAVLNLENGSQVEAQAITEEMEDGKSGKCRILWERVINMEDIESISLNGTVISL